MKKSTIVTILLCILLAGCEFTVPLVDDPTVAINPTLLGLWQKRNDDGKLEKLLVLPLGEREYLVSWPAGENDSMYARTCLTESSGFDLAQLKWFGTAEGTLPDDQDDRLYQFANYALNGENELTIRMLNADLVGRDVPSTAALAAAIARHKNASDLWREPMVFRRVQR